jgi:phosphatidylethanolamine/phosphatidyl-N-methylethanolamine N-methyltransferase
MPQQKPVYDRLAPGYDRAMRPLEGWLLGRLRARALGALAGGARLVEVGAGTGANFHFYPAGAQGVATEPSGEMLELARANAARPPGVRLARCPAERLPFADGTFDAGLATLTLCSVESPARALTELRRVVRPGGLVVLLEHVRPAGALGHLFDALSLLTVALLDDHFNRRTADEARRAGLELLRVERHALGIIQLIVCRVA